MTRWHLTLRWTAAAVAAAAVCGLTACSTDGEPTAVGAASSAATDPSVNVAALDTGRYPTEPRAPFGRATDDQIVQVEGQRMAQFIVVPFEIDPDLTNNKMPTSAIASRQNLAVVIGDKAPDIPANADLLYGFSTTASTPDANLRAGSNRSLNNMVLRYQTPAAADAAAGQLAQVLSEQNKTPVTELPGLPAGTHVVRSNIGGDEKLVTLTPHGVYVIYEWYETTPAQKSMLEPTVRKAISLQSTLIDQFSATPTKAEAKARNITGPTRPIVDQNRVLIYALPYTDQEIKDANTGLTPQSMRSVYGPRGMAHFSSDPVGTFTELNDAGSTANAVERSVVMRAATADKAAKLLHDYARDGKSRDIGSPPGLPTARCVTTNDAADMTYTCRVQNGRYLADIHSNNKTDAYQQIAAQYVILTKADQNAN